MHIAARANQYDPVAAEFARSRARAYRAAAAEPTGSAFASPYRTLTVVPRQTVNEAATDGQTVPALSLSTGLAVLDVNALLEGSALPLSMASGRITAISRLPEPPTDADAPESIDGLLSRVLAVG